VTQPFHHTPVLLGESLRALDLRSGGAYLDGTVGGGGHSLGILQALQGQCALTCLDRDQEALEAARARLARYPQVRFVHGNFHQAQALLPGQRFDGILLDLGVSSHQLDQPHRGFSYHEEAPLDMRMDQEGGPTAADWLNTAPEGEIAGALRDYADERWAVRIARIILEMRAQRPLETTQDLVRAVDRAIPRAVRRREEGHPARRTFQAVRIAVNDEIAPLRAALTGLLGMLTPGGRLVVITFHSIEDRVVKRAFNSFRNPCVCPVDAPLCVCGRQPLASLPRGYPVSPGEEELRTNPRARSARLRVAQKL